MLKHDTHSTWDRMIFYFYFCNLSFCFSVVQIGWDFVYRQCRTVSGRTLVKCSLEVPSKVLTKHVLSGLAASLIFISPANQVSTVFLNPRVLLLTIEISVNHAISRFDMSNTHQEDLLNVLTVFFSQIHDSKVLNCGDNCSFIAILDVGGNCGQMQLMWLQLQLWFSCSDSENLDAVAEIMITSCLLKLCWWWCIETLAILVHNLFYNSIITWTLPKAKAIPIKY